MTTQTQPQPLETAPPAPKRSGASIAAIATGAVLALFGAGIAIAGGAALGVFGGDGTLNSGSHSLSTRSTALVSDVAKINDIKGVTDVLGQPRVRLSAHATGPAGGLFVGVGPARQVDHYLRGAPIETVTDLDVDPYRLDKRARPGTRRPGRPADQRFWVAQASGRDSATLRWRIRDGAYRVVVMNADGSRGVRADGDVGLTVPHLPAIAWSVVGGGLLLLAGGMTAIVLGARRPRS